MAGLSFEVSLNDLRSREALGQLTTALDDLTPLMGQIGQALVMAAWDRIGQTNMTPEGTPWPQSHRAREHGGPTLQDTDASRSSINAWAARDHVVVGSNMVYAAVHRFGAERGAFGAAIGRTKPTRKRPRSQDYFMPLPWGDIPARPYLGISDEDEQTITELTENFLADLVNALA